MTKHIQESTIIFLTVIAVLAIALIVETSVILSIPAQEDNTLQYKGWTIYMPTTNSTYTVYTAMKNGHPPITGVDLPGIIADITEAER